MLNKPLLSILIPTKNREEYAIKVVSNVLKINDDRLQVVIQDNSNSKGLEGVLSPFFKDLRLHYFYNDKVLSFVENFSLGIGNCTGEYITIIGDDDGINPRIIDIAKWAKENSVSAITPSLPIVYYWPASQAKTRDANAAYLSQLLRAIPGTAPLPPCPPEPRAVPGTSTCSATTLRNLPDSPAPSSSPPSPKRRRRRQQRLHEPEHHAAC